VFYSRTKRERVRRAESGFGKLNRTPHVPGTFLNVLAGIVMLEVNTGEFAVHAYDLVA